jgi:hypothetical protein
MVSRARFEVDALPGEIFGTRLLFTRTHEAEGQGWRQFAKLGTNGTELDNVPAYT